MKAVWSLPQSSDSAGNIAHAHLLYNMVPSGISCAKTTEEA